MGSAWSWGVTGRTAIAACGTHPTGMHSCVSYVLIPTITNRSWLLWYLSTYGSINFTFGRWSVWEWRVVGAQDTTKSGGITAGVESLDNSIIKADLRLSLHHLVYVPETNAKRRHWGHSVQFSALFIGFNKIQGSMHNQAILAEEEAKAKFLFDACHFFFDLFCFRFRFHSVWMDPYWVVTLETTRTIAGICLEKSREKFTGAWNLPLDC